MMVTLSEYLSFLMTALVTVQGYLRNCHPELFCKIAILKDFTKFARKHIRERHMKLRAATTGVL